MTTKKIALITGGSSGIGYAISTYFAKAGYDLLWVALNEKELQQAKTTLQQSYDCEIDTLCKNLCTASAVDEIYEWTQQNDYKVDVLINNAGFGNFGFVSELSMQREVDLIHCNILATYKLSRYFLNAMENRNEGTIINISSNSSFQPVPKMSTYAASKSFVTQFSRSVSEELKIKKSKVRMICVCPSAIKDTNFKNTNNMCQVKTFNGIAATTAKEVAKDVWQAFVQGNDFVVTGTKMRMLYSIAPLIPYPVKQFLVRQEIKVNN